MDGHNLRSSMNGTWVYMSQEWKVTDQMTFKVADVLFRAVLADC